jgi:hypothetical protein
MRKLKESTREIRKMMESRQPSPPLEFSEARQTGRQIASARREAVDALEKAVLARAEAEAEYHHQRALAMVEMKKDQVAVTEAQERVKGEVADHLLAREKAANDVLILQEKLASIDGERATFHRLMEWSMKLGLD